MLHHENFRFYSNVLNLLLGFNSTKFNQRHPLPSCKLLPYSCWISCNSAVHFHCRVCTPHKKLLVYDTDIEAAAATADPAFIWGAATLCDSVHLPIVPSSSSFYQAFNFLDGRGTTLMSVSAALVSLFLPFTHIHIGHSRIKGTSRFNSLYFGSTYDFTILCNSYDIFPHHKRFGQIF